MTVLYSLLGVCLSIALLLTALARRSISLAILNFLLCLIPVAMMRPWEILKVPEAAASVQSLWTGAILWSCIIAANVGGILVCIILRLSSEKPSRRRRRRRRVDASEFSFADEGQAAGEKEEAPKRRSRSSGKALQ